MRRQSRPLLRRETQTEASRRPQRYEWCRDGHRKGDRDGKRVVRLPRLKAKFMKRRRNDALSCVGDGCRTVEGVTPVDPEARGTLRPARLNDRDRRLRERSLGTCDAT